MKLLDFATFALAIGVSLASPTLHGHVRHEKRIDMQQWLKRSRVSPDTTLPVRVAIAQKDVHVGHNLLMEISDPKSKNYGKYLSAKEVGDMFRPSSKSISYVREWLHNSGIDLDRHSVSAGHSWLKFNATVQELESLLLTEYHVYQHRETREEHIGCNEYHVPHAVQEHIDFITPAVSTVRVSRKSENRIMRRVTPSAAQNGTDKLPWAGAACHEAVKPECIRSLYDIPISNSSISGNEFGLFEDGDYYNQTDLDLTFAAIAPYIKNGTHPILEGVDGGTAPLPSEGGVESNLDMAVIFPLIHPQDVILFQVDDLKAVETYQGFANTFLDAVDASYCTFEGGDDPVFDPHYPDTGPNPPNETWVAPGTWDKPEMCGAYKPTNVISISYGIAEGAYSYFYINRQCQEYMKLGLQGVSIIYASQDSGVASGGCIHPDNVNKTTLAANPGAFSPGWPAACPYVTSVGATKINPGESLSESAASIPGSDFYSGGGFSNHWPAPDYQKGTLDSYFTNTPPPYDNLTIYGTPYYNRTGRGYPDVSAVGVNIPVYEAGQPVLEYGTSASAPIFASIINLINEHRIAAGKGPVGFLNPVLYKHPEAFTDILTGNNPGCGTQGFSAVKGWDPVTGLGTPNFLKLLDVFMALP